jgi:hypothetical protein
VGRVGRVSESHFQLPESPVNKTAGCRNQNRRVMIIVKEGGRYENSNVGGIMFDPNTGKSVKVQTTKQQEVLLP